MQTPAKTMAIPRITLGPATTDPPVSGSPKKDRLGLLLAAFLIPLGALAFGFAIWLYATRSSDEKRGVAKETSASALLPSEVPTTAVAAVTPHVTQVEGSATSTETSATTAASSVSPSASSAKPTKGRRTIPPKNTAAQPPTGQTHTGRVLPMRP